MKFTKEEQVLLNFKRWAIVNEAPYWTLYRMEKDRVLITPDVVNEWIVWLNEHTSPWTLGIDAHRPFGNSSAIQGWRENKPFVSAQFILHVDLDGRLVLEVDWDIGNPNGGLLPLAIHGLEYIFYRVFRTKTDPFFIHKALVRRFEKETLTS